MCIDYWKLNSNTVPTPYPLPLIQPLVEKLKGKTFITALDLKSGYNLICMIKAEEWKAAFKTKYGLFEPLVMMFGQSRAPGIFQYLMNDIFQDNIDVYVVIYLDDILLFSDSLDEHIEHIKEVLRRLRKHQPYCNLEKCVFTMKEVHYLGVIVSQEGVRVDPDKVTKADDWATPHTVKAVQEFLGFVNFYCRFIDEFSKCAQPLYNLLRKENPWKWGPEKEKAFQSLKKALIEAPVLIQPDVAKEFLLECDASDFATGAILSQLGSDDEMHPVAFLSKSLSPAECNYDIFDKELLAVIRALKEWRHLLEGSEIPVKVLTDHKNLEYFSTKRDLNRRQDGWEFWQTTTAGSSTDLGPRIAKQIYSPDEKS